jgi:rRNA-processing protein FCF1
MSLRTEGIDLHTILQLNDEELNKEIKELKFELIRKIETVTNKLADLLKSSLDKADVIIGSGTFFSSTLLPLETAFLTCGIDTGSFTLLNNQREITVNPFLLFWLISSSFKLSNNIEIEPSLLPVTLIPMGLEEKKIPIRRIKLKVYSPSKLCVEAFYNSEDDAKQWVKEKFFNIINFKKYFVGGDFLLPFTSPLRIEEIELSSFEAVPFIDATPYGPIIYKEGLIIPEISSGTEVEIEFFTNPLYDKTRPLILDTNVISLMAFPYRPESLFFRTFMENREILLPAIAIYELKRKFSVGKERLGIINALNRLTEMHGAGLIKIRVIGEITPESYEVSRTKNKKNLKAIKSDFRDSLILLEAKRQNAILFTNDKSLREIAILLGIPSISYNSLLDDVSEVLMEKEYVKEEELIKLVKESVKEVRGEEYTNEEIKMALSYLKFSGKIMFEGEFIKWIKTILSKKSFI